MAADGARRLGKAGLRAALLGSLALVGACSELDETPLEPRQPAAYPDSPVSSPPLRSTPPQPVALPPKDACGAEALAHLVGKNKSEIPVPVNPSQRRVACNTCPVTEELRPWRLNIFYDAKTGVITEVRCG